MLNKEDKVIITASLDGKHQVPIEIPRQGSLGLLALGYRGIMAWREARNKAIKADKLNVGEDKK